MRTMLTKDKRGACKEEETYSKFIDSMKETSSRLLGYLSKCGTYRLLCKRISL